MDKRAGKHEDRDEDISGEAERGMARGEGPESVFPFVARAHVRSTPSSGLALLLCDPTAGEKVGTSASGEKLDHVRDEHGGC